MFSLRRLLVLSIVLMAPGLMAMKPTLAQAKPDECVRERAKSGPGPQAVVTAPEPCVLLAQDSDYHMSNIKEFFESNCVLCVAGLRDIIFAYHGPELVTYETVAITPWRDTFIPRFVRFNEQDGFHTVRIQRNMFDRLALLKAVLCDNQIVQPQEVAMPTKQTASTALVSPKIKVLDDEDQDNDSDSDDDLCVIS